MASMLVLLFALTLGQEVLPQGQAVGPLGRWKLTSLVDDGEPIPAHQVRQSLSTDGLFAVDGQTITLTMPGQRKRVLLYRTNSLSYPKSIDITSSDGRVSKGIYRQDGDVLLICLAAPEEPHRPVEFAAESGSNSMLLVLTAERASVQPASTGSISTAPTTFPQPTPSRDQQYYNQLVGTWGHQDKDEIVYNTLNSDGSYSQIRKSKKVFKKLFDEETRTSGTWKVENGAVVARVTASTDREKNGQVFSYKINSISATDAVFIDQMGQPRREWKVR